MARPKSKEDGRRDEIVRAALRLILKLGYNQVTLADIAEQVGVSKGLISYYFPKKEDVFFAVLEQIVDRLTTDFEGFYRTEVPGRREAAPDLPQPLRQREARAAATTPW